MGFTHYWNGDTLCPTATWDQVRADLLKVMGEAGIPLAGGHGTGLPVIMGKVICFNGVEENSHETFNVLRGMEDAQDFCKTARKPYDIVVCAALIILKHHIPKFKVSSDGDESDWQPAIDLCRRTLNYGVYPCKDEKELPPVPTTPVAPEFEFKRMIPEGLKSPKEK